MLSLSCEVDMTCLKACSLLGVRPERSLFAAHEGKEKAKHMYRTRRYIFFMSYQFSSFVGGPRFSLQPILLPALFSQNEGSSLVSSFSSNLPNVPKLDRTRLRFNLPGHHVSLLAAFGNF